MGTRALITKKGQPFIATHWDGYPSGLGEDLLAAQNDEAIIVAAKQHSIDFAAPEVIAVVGEERIQMLMKRHDLSREKILDGIRRGGIISSDDYEISDISEYGDFAEYQYDWDEDTGEWRFRSLSGSYPESMERAGDWYPLTIEGLERYTKDTDDE